MPNDQDVDLTVRFAEAADVDALAKLMGELGYETCVSDMEARMKAIAQDSRYRTFVAVKNGKVCGMIGTLAHSNYEDNDITGRLLVLVVSSAARRLGIGKKLMGAAEKDFAERKISCISLTSQLRRKNAHKLFESLGYEKTGYRYVKKLPRDSR